MNQDFAALWGCAHVAVEAIDALTEIRHDCDWPCTDAVALSLVVPAEDISSADWLELALEGFDGSSMSMLNDIATRFTAVGGLTRSTDAMGIGVLHDFLTKFWFMLAEHSFLTRDDQGIYWINERPLDEHLYCVGCKMRPCRLATPSMIYTILNILFRFSVHQPLFLDFSIASMLPCMAFTPAAPHIGLPLGLVAQQPRGCVAPLLRDHDRVPIGVLGSVSDGRHERM